MDNEWKFSFCAATDNNGPKLSSSGTVGVKVSSVHSNGKYNGCCNKGEGVPSFFGWKV